MRTIGSASGQHHFFVLSILSILTFSMAASVALGRRINGSGNHNNQFSISSAGPQSGPATGGTTVTLSGTGFTSSAVVSFGGIAAPSVVVASSTKLQVVTPAHASGTVNVAVTENPHNQTATLVGGFTYVSTSSTTLGVSSASPATGPTSGGTVVTITGKGFQAGAAVKFGGSQSTGVTVGSSTQITAMSPPGSSGTVSITVTNPDAQSASLLSGFTYTTTTTLAVSGASPATGPTCGGTVVTITGKGFKAGAAVKFGGSQSTAVTVASSTQVNAMSPAESSGTVPITVTNPDTQAASLPSGFTYSSGPAVSSVSPNSGPVSGGTTVKILGSGFQSGVNVTFGGIAATSVTLVSSTEIQAVSPVSPADTVSIAVTNTDSQSAALASAFTYFHTVTLSWTAGASGVSGFNVYRSSTSGGPYARLNSALLSGASFSDNHVQAGQTYFYVATSVNSNNAESGYSSQARAIVPTP
jgi:IPT/TIG domain